MRHTLNRLLPNRKVLIAGVCVLALFVIAPAALSQPGVVFQIVTPEVTVLATDSSATEAGLTTGTFTISRTGDTTDPVTVNYSVTGTAVNGTDYAMLGTTAIIPAAQSSVNVVVTPIDEAAPEDDETVILTLTSGTGYTVGSPSAATVTITDNDLPTVTVVAGDAAASEAGPNTGSFTVSRNGPTTDALSVAYNLTGTAGNGTDYSALASTVLIPVGQASATVTVTPTNDGAPEPAETVILTIATNALYTVGSPSAATVTITDNDLPTVTVVAGDAAASEAGPNTGSFTVSRNGPTTDALSVAYNLTGTAGNGTDYSALASTVLIPVGQASATVTVTPTNDGAPEPAETVILTIATNALYTVGSPSAATVTITDNDLPTVNIEATDDSAAEAGSATGTFTITRSGDLTAALTVNYTISGSAGNGTDYAALSGSVVIPAGSGAVAVTVTPVDDAIDEANETVILTLAAGTGYQIGSSNDDTVTIADNDGSGPPPVGTMPTSKDQCKKDGWQTFGVFKNQGDCVSWVATAGKNPPAG